MADKAVAVLSKPQMRNLLAAQMKKNLAVAIVLSVASGLTFKYTVMEPRKQRYADFYRTYDIEKEFEEMRKKGLFQSC